MSSNAWALIKVSLALLLVLALMLLALWFVRRYLAAGRAGLGTGLKIVGGIWLGQKERVMVVEVLNEWLVLGVTGENIRLLAQYPKPEQASSPMVGAETMSFKHELQRLLRKNHAPTSS